MPGETGGRVPSIPEFYEGKSVFITGATGFLGQALLEKLLRSCPGLKTVYILIRGKKGKDSSKRLDELLSSSVFDRVKEERPEATAKVVAVNGDISLPQLGLSETDAKLLIDNVSVVFHSAAIVKLNAPLKTAVEMNVLATRRVLELAKQMVLIEAFIFVSTISVLMDVNEDSLNSDQEVVKAMKVSPQQIIEITKWMPDDILEMITPKLLEGRPYTYMYTKALAEDLVLQESGSVPVAIVRPSLAVAAWKEPFPGWTDGLFGPSGLFVAAYKGVLRTFLSDKDSPAFIIPVDVAVNLILATAWHTAIYRPDQVPVYNCDSGSVNPLKWETMFRLLSLQGVKYPSSRVFRIPGGSTKKSCLANRITVIFDHYLPALLVDLLACLLLQKPRMTALYRKLHKAMNLMEYICARKWKFQCKNAMLLNDLLSEDDRKSFYLDVRSLDWAEYSKNQVLGWRKYLLKEDPSTIPAARKSLRRRYWLVTFLQVLLMAGIWKTFFYSAL